ncbi:DNA adenine methylase [Brevibacillus centrosporus]|uniref:DNA adenine methylase n=1 Tax=Brevibacillus centrosporus TaxID=54910 RepID=UPI0039870AF0
MVELICQFCESEHEPEEAEIDPLQQGFWCQFCDGYTYFENDREDRHRFTLILEDRKESNPMPSSSIHVSFNTRISPLRYAGGKSKVIPYVFSKLQSNSTKTLVSPFAGGASVELALLDSGVIEHLILNDLDFGVYALFWTVLHAPDELYYRLQHANPSQKDYFHAQGIVKSDYLSCNMIEAAWSMLLVNRLAYSGIYSANPLGGRNGNKADLLSRWNPIDLQKRMKRIHQMGDKITLHNMDACTLIEEEYWRPHTTIFLDPPYVKKGKQLYRCYYHKDDHIQLNLLLDSLYHGMPGADIILMYDNDPLIEEIYMYPTVEKVGRVYSI